VRAGLQFTKQPRVLNRDHRLVGKGGDNLDLPFGERLDAAMREGDGTNGLTLPHQRHAERCADLAEGKPAPTGDKGSLARDRPKLGLRCTERTRHGAVDLALAYVDPCGFGAAKAGGGFDYRVQHRLHIAGRAADHVEHVAGRGLVFERLLQIARALVQFVEQPDRLDRDHRLVGKGLQQLDLLVAERARLCCVPR